MIRALLMLSVAAALAGCGTVNAGKNIVGAIKSGQPLDEALAVVTAADTNLALQEAQAIGDAVTVPCLQKANAIAQMIEKDGPSPGVATDMERAIALKQVEIACAGPIVASGKSLALP